MEKILLDTDIGCDIDDAICVAYLLARKDCELLGVTTVNGDVELRAQLASAIVKADGRSIPIYPGARDTILLDRKRKPVGQAAALERMPHDVGFETGRYLDFMRDIILSNPGEVTLLAIGPMTNVGLLFAAHPETAAALKRLVLMGGNFMHPETGRGYMESNTMCDPHASALVYRAQVKEHMSIGNDVTFELGMDRETVYRLFSRHHLLRAVLPMVDRYFSSGAPALYFHDLCAAMTIFRSDLADFVHGHVDVELHADALMGMTVLKGAAYLDGRHRVAAHVNREVFYNEFAGTFGIDEKEVVSI